MKKVEIKKEDLKKNLDYIKSKLSKNADNVSTQIIVVVKGNGMGLGLKEISNFLLDNYITYLAVSTYEEAIELYSYINERESKSFKILLLSPISNLEEIKDLVSKNIILTIGSLENEKFLDEVLASINYTEKYPVHLKIDTGLGRYGVYYENCDEVLEIFENSSLIDIQGMFTHFSKPIDEKWTRTQFERFEKIVALVKEKGFNPGICHSSASTAFLKYPDMQMDAVRIGSLIQGRSLIEKEKFRKIGELVTNVEEIRNLPKGAFVSYNKTFKTKKDTKVAVIPVGYKDGYGVEKQRDDFSFINNLISVYIELKKIFKNNEKYVKINGKKYKVIGKIGMYHTIIDVTDSDVKIGDKVYIDISPILINEKIRRDYV